MEVMARKLGTAAFKYFNTERNSKPRLTFDSSLFLKILDAWYNGMGSKSERDGAMDKFIEICRDDRVGLKALAVDLEIQREPSTSALPGLASKNPEKALLIPKQNTFSPAIEQPSPQFKPLVVTKSQTVQLPAALGGRTVRVFAVGGGGEGRVS